MDFETVPMTDFEALQKEADDLAVQAKAKADEAAAARSTARASVVEKMKADIALFAITSTDLGMKIAKPAKRKAKPATNGVAPTAAPPKYRSPTGLTWSGMGRTPKWMIGLNTAGRDALRI